MKFKAHPPPKDAAEVRQQLDAILSAAASGRTTMITRHGRTIAAVVPASAVPRRQVVSLLALAGSGRGLWGRSSAHTVGKLRDEWSR